MRQRSTRRRRRVLHNGAGRVLEAAILSPPLPTGSATTSVVAVETHVQIGLGSDESGTLQREKEPGIVP